MEGIIRVQKRFNDRKNMLGKYIKRKFTKRRSVLYEIFTSYLFLIMFTLLLIGIVYFTTIKIAENIIGDYNTYALGQVGKELNLIISEMDEVHKQLFF